MKTILNILLIGALTSKPYAFKSRPWELKQLETIDLYDSLGSNIKINYKGSEILRIIPNINESINEEWISDKARFAFDGLNRWRFNTPLVKNNSIYIPVSWEKIFFLIQKEINLKKIKNIVGYTSFYTSLENIAYFKDMLVQNKKTKLIFNPYKNNLNNDLFNFYILNKNFFLNENNTYILIGSNLRIENPLLNLFFRRESKKEKIFFVFIGSSYKSTIYMYHLGNTIKTLLDIIRGKHKFFYINYLFQKKNISLKNTNNITLLFGLDFIYNYNSSAIFNAFFSLKEKKFNIKFIHETVGELNSFLCNFNTDVLIDKTEGTLHYLLNTENFCESTNENDVILYQGHHNVKLIKQLNYILPSTTFVEENSTYLNCFGFFQKTKAMIHSFDNVKNNYLIFNMFYWFCLKPLFTENKDFNLKKIDSVMVENYEQNFSFKNNLNILIYFLYKENKIQYNIFKSNLVNYYINNSVLLASKTMQKCSTLFFKNKYTYIWK